jgi:hypothetical protein
MSEIYETQIIITIQTSADGKEEARNKSREIIWREYNFRSSDDECVDIETRLIKPNQKVESIYYEE